MTAHGETAQSSVLEPSAVPPPSTPADERFQALARDRFDALMRRFPVYATYLGIDDYDGDLADGSRDAVLADIEAGSTFGSALEALDESELSAHYAI